MFNKLVQESPVPKLLREKVDSHTKHSPMGMSTPAPGFLLRQHASSTSTRKRIAAELTPEQSMSRDPATPEEDTPRMQTTPAHAAEDHTPVQTTTPLDEIPESPEGSDGEGSARDSPSLAADSPPEDFHNAEVAEPHSATEQDAEGANDVGGADQNSSDDPLADEDDGDGEFIARLRSKAPARKSGRRSTRRTAATAHTVAPAVAPRGKKVFEDVWTDEEIATYSQSLADHGKDFSKVRVALGGSKNISQIVHLWEKQRHKHGFESLVRRDSVDVNADDTLEPHVDDEDFLFDEDEAGVEADKSTLAPLPDNSDGVRRLGEWWINFKPRGIQVEGFIENGTQWHSSTIVQRVNFREVQTKSGTTYALSGAFVPEKCDGVSNGAILAFKKCNRGQGGFPLRWQKVLSKEDDLADPVESGATRTAPKSRKQRGHTMKSVPQSKRSRPIEPKDETIEVPLEAIKNAGTSRSGRKIVPPLAYWKGQRIVENVGKGEVNLVMGSSDTTPMSDSKLTIDQVDDDILIVTPMRTRLPSRSTVKVKREPVKRKRKNTKRTIETESSETPTVRVPTSKSNGHRAMSVEAEASDALIDEHGTADEGSEIEDSKRRRIDQADVRESSVDSPTSFTNKKPTRPVHPRRGRSREQPKPDPPAEFSEPARATRYATASATRKKSAVHDEHEVSEPKWTDAELEQLDDAVQTHTRTNQRSDRLWQAVSRQVGTHTAEECCSKHMERTQPNFAVSEPEPVEVRSATSTSTPKLTAKRGTLAAKRQIRDILDHEDVGHNDDVFDSTPLRGAVSTSKGLIVKSKKGPKLAQKNSAKLRGLGRSTHLDSDGEATPGLLRKHVSRKDVDAYVKKHGKKSNGSVSAKTFQGSENKKRSNPRSTSKDMAVLAALHSKSKSTEDDDPGEEDYYFSDPDSDQ